MRNFSSLRFSAVALTLLVSLAVVSPASATNGSRALITSAVNENDLVTLSGNTRPEAIPANDRGRVSDDLVLQNMQLQLRRPAEQEQALEAYIDSLQKPGSPNYHQWLTAARFGQQYGLNKSDLAKISTWLQGHGFTVNVVYTNGMVIDFTGTAGMIREAFHTDIHNLKVNGEMHVANMSDPKIPAALAPAVVGIGQLNNFKPNTMYVNKGNYTVVEGGSTYYLVVPADLATIYNLNPLFAAGTTGKGQTIVVVEDANMLRQDWVSFRSIFGLGSYTSGNLELVHPASSGTNNCFNPSINGDSSEASIDAEYASASAPDATIEMATCQDTFTFGGLIAIENLLNASSQPPAIISMSYGICEATGGAALNAQFNSAFQQAVSEGVSVFVSAGDAAAAGCGRGEPTTTTGIGITGWGETPYNVAVGGTDFGDSYLNENSAYWSSTNGPTYGSALSYVPEIPWDDSCASDLISTYVGYPTPWNFCRSAFGTEFYNNVGGSGGPSACATGTPSMRGVVSGTCKGYAKPSWQQGFGVVNDGVRDIPDVSLFAANGVWSHYYPFCDSEFAPCTAPPVNWPGAGGTSFSSPILAGMQALVNQVNGSRQGNPNVVFYQLAANEYGSSGNAGCNSTLGNTAASNCVFYDVTLGNMDVDCIGNIDCYVPGSGSVGVLSTSDSSYEPAYSSAPGWDMATGLGSVNAYNLVNQWSTAAPKAARDK
ncbi:MAG TPA: S53 family peptidase [Candidatus Aquilonibacter sp.]|nr:S53 family peptidase [Candidatus Aquilonibacter sp.]